MILLNSLRKFEKKIMFSYVISYLKLCNKVHPNFVAENCKHL